MSYDVSALFTVSSCRVVFVKDSDTADGIEKAVVACKPEYKTETNQAFLPKKIGPFTFKNRKSLWKILMKAEDAEEGGAEFLRKLTKRMALDAYEARIPSVLSSDQIERASVMYDAMNHRFKFLINDSDTLLDVGSVPNGYTIATWMKYYVGYEWVSCELIWITYMKEKELMEKLGEEGMKDRFYSFFTVEGDRVVARDKNTLQERYFSRQVTEPEYHAPRRRRTAVDYAAANQEKKQKPADTERTMTPEEAYQEGRKYDVFSGLGLPSATDAPKEAFRWYQAAAEGGNIKAQNCLGLLYQCGFGGCETDLTKALFWYTQAAFNEDYDERTADADTKLCHNAAQGSVKDLILRTTNGTDLVRKFVGAKAEALIEEAEQEKALANLNMIDADDARRSIERFREKYW